MDASPVQPSSGPLIFSAPPASPRESPVRPHHPRAITSEEFATFRALVVHLLPGLAAGPHAAEVAAVADRLLFTRALESETAMPRDVQAIRSGLQLLNWDALRIHSTCYCELDDARQEFLIRIIGIVGDEHWPQLPAGEWLAAMEALVAAAIADLRVSDSEEQEVQTESNAGRFRWSGLEGAISG